MSRVTLHASLHSNFVSVVVVGVSQNPDHCFLLLLPRILQMLSKSLFPCRPSSTTTCDVATTHHHVPHRRPPRRPHRRPPRRKSSPKVVPPETPPAGLVPTISRRLCYGWLSRAAAPRCIMTCPRASFDRHVCRHVSCGRATIWAVPCGVIATFRGFLVLLFVQ